MVRPCITPATEIKDSAFVYVDVAFLQHTINYSNPDLAATIFCLNPSNDEAVKKVVVTYALEIVNALSPLGVAEHNMMLVFEDGSPKSDRRAARNASRKSGLLNSAVRHLLLSSKESGKAEAKRTISQQMGRPSWWFVDLVCDFLENIDYQIFRCPNGIQADQFVAVHSLSKKYDMLGDDIIQREIIVYGNDRDFLALMPRVDRLMFSNHGNVFQLERATILATLGATNEAIFVAYCAGGCDDIAGKVAGMGFKTAFKQVKSFGISWLDVKSIQLALPSLPVDLVDEILRLFQQYNSYEFISEHCKVSREKQVSMLRQYLNEKDSSGVYRRHRLRERVDQAKLLPQVANQKVARTKEEWRAKQFQHRQQIALNRRLFKFTLANPLGKCLKESGAIF